MPINSISPIFSSAAVTPYTNTTTEGGSSSFASFLQDAIAQVVETDYTSKITNLQTVTGDVNDIHNATIAATKAELALNLTLQIRNKIIESYQEVMRMQI